MPRLWFIQGYAEALLLDQYVRFRDVHVDPFRVSIRPHDLLFEINTFRHPLNAEDVGQYLDPV